MNIVLLEPEIPHNTGAIGRTCVAVNAALHLIRPLGFNTNEKSLRRSGLDYWRNLNVSYYENYEHFLEYFKKEDTGTLFFATTKAQKKYTDVSYDKNSYIMFGKESAGIPEELLLANRDNCIRIPMLSSMRSLNLSVSAGIVLYEALRQNQFDGLSEAGQLHRYSWQ